MFKYKDNLDQWHEVAELDENGKVLEEQLPDMDYVPTSRKINGEALDHDLTISGMPAVTSADDGKGVLVADGAWAVTPIYSAQINKWGAGD